MSNWYKTGPQNLIKAKFKFLNESIRSNKDSGQIKRNESQDSQGLSKFYTIRSGLFGFSEHLFYGTPFDGCLYTF